MHPKWVSKVSRPPFEQYKYSSNEKIKNQPPIEMTLENVWGASDSKESTENENPRDQSWATKVTLEIYLPSYLKWRH